MSTLQIIVCAGFALVGISFMMGLLLFLGELKDEPRRSVNDNQEDDK